MRLILALVISLLALPAFAQEGQECRGKQAFDLGNGASGCLLDVGITAITTTRTRNTSGNSSSSGNDAGRIRVLMFGAHNTSKKVISPRLRAICQTFLPTLKAETPGKRFNRIVIVMVWPRVANTGDYVPVADAEVDVQIGFSGSACRVVRYFG